MKKFDKYQKSAIDAEKNSVVSAGAGSGKTTVLAERFSRLIIEKGYDVEEILTLTFTKKATVEMSERIYKVLKQKVPNQAQNFYKNNIKTLDSYCNYVAKMGAHFYGISPDFTQDEDAIKKQITAMALPFILEHRENEAIKSLVKADNFDKIADELLVDPMITKSMVATPIDFDECERKQKTEILSAWKSATDEATKNVDALLTVMTDVQKVDAPCLTESDIENADCSRLLSYINFIEKLAKTDLPKGKTNAATQTKKNCINNLRGIFETLIPILNYLYSFKTTKAAFPLLKEFQEKVNDVKRSSSILTFADVSNLALKTLIEHPEIRQIEKERYRAIMIDEFQDNNSMQRDMLFLLAENINRNEKSVPRPDELLLDKLFFVGDEKQSIYRFRGADVSVFRELSRDFANGNLAMTNNYRSQPALVAAFNTIFGGEIFSIYSLVNQISTKDYPQNQRLQAVFYTEEEEKICAASKNPIPPYEAVYKSATFPAIKANDIDYFHHIHFALYDMDLNANAKDKFGVLTEENAEAQWVANKIEEVVNRGINGKRYKYEDIAILFRTYSLQPLYERTFLNNGIPYDTEVITGFFADGVVNDIFAFLRLCVYEDDVMSYMQILCSPWLNFSVSQADAIVALDAKPFSLEVLRILDEKSKYRFVKVKDFYEKIKISSQTEPLTQTLTRLWFDSGYRYETIWNQSVEMYAKLYDVIFELAHQCDEKNMSLAGFIDSALIYKDDLTDKTASTKKIEGVDIPMEKSGGVHILTIHKSKGLEYPIVFVCGTQKGSNNEKNDKVVYASKDYGITINTTETLFKKSTKYAVNYFFKKASKLEKSQEQAELRRLVYVALTRAKDELFITNGKYKVLKQSTKDGKAISTIFDALKPFYDFYSNMDSDDVEPKPFDVEHIPPYMRVTGNTKSTFRKNNSYAKNALIQQISRRCFYTEAKIITKDEIEEKYLYPSHLYDEEKDKSENTIADEGEYSKQNPFYRKIDGILDTNYDFRKFGTTAHAFLEAAVSGKPAKLSQNDILLLDGNAKKCEIVKDVCAEMWKNFKVSALGKSALESEWKRCEYAFKSAYEGKIMKGAMDLVFRDADGNYNIVDYKTNYRILPELYYVQLACYKNAIMQMKDITDSKKVKCYLYYLRFDKAVLLDFE